MTQYDLAAMSDAYRQRGRAERISDVFSSFKTAIPTIVNMARNGIRGYNFTVDLSLQEIADIQEDFEKAVHAVFPTAKVELCSTTFEISWYSDFLRFPPLNISSECDTETSYDLVAISDNYDLDYESRVMSSLIAEFEEAIPEIIERANHGIREYHIGRFFDEEETKPYYDTLSKRVMESFPSAHLSFNEKWFKISW